MQKIAGPRARTPSTSHSRSHKPIGKNSSGTNSFCSEHNYSKFTIDKLDLSNIMNASEFFQFLPNTDAPSTNIPSSSFNDATISSKMKANRKESSETVGKEVFYLNFKNEGHAGESEPYEALFPASDVTKSACQAQPSRAESCLWDLTYSQEDKSREYGQHRENAQGYDFSYLSGYNDLSLKHNQSLLENLSIADHPETVKKLKDMIHKLQLKDAIQRQEIAKLKKVNEKIQTDSRSLEERVGSLERLRSVDSHYKSNYNSQQNSRPGSEYGKSKYTSSNCSFQEGASFQYEQKFQDLSSKTTYLMKQIEQINSEKKNLEENIKSMLLEKELAKASTNDTKKNLHEMISNFASTNSNIHNSSIPIENANPSPKEQHGLQTPQSQPETPQKQVLKGVYLRDHSKQGSAEKSPLYSQKQGGMRSTPKSDGKKKLAERSSNKKDRKSDAENVHSREASPAVRSNKKNTTYSQLAGKLRGITNSANTPISPLHQELRFNSPQVNDFASKTSVYCPESSKDYESSSKSLFCETQKELNSSSKSNPLLADYNSKRCPTFNLKLNSTNVQPTRASSPIPVKVLPSYSIPLKIETKSENELKKHVHEDHDSESQDNSQFNFTKKIDTSVLNNVTPAVVDIISQYQSNQRCRSNPRSHASTRTNDFKERTGGILSSASRLCARRLNLENLSTYESREKENKKIDPEWIRDLGLGTITSYNTNLAFNRVQHQQPQKLDLNTIDRHIEESDSILELMEREKQAHDSMNLTLDELSEYRTRRQKPLGETKIFHNINALQATGSEKNNMNKTQPLYSSNEPSSRSVTYPVILNSQAQGKLISPRRAQQVLENIRAKMQRK